MAYAAGKEAGVVIWISPKFRDEHKQTLDWLNQITDDSVSFFGIELELLQIGDSLPAPYLKVVAQPSEWSGTEPSSPGLTERQKRYQQFFAELLEKVKTEHPGVTQARKAYPQSWYGYPVGRSGFSILTGFGQDGRFSVTLNIASADRDRNKAAYDALLEGKESIEARVGETLSWDRMDDKIASYISCSVPGTIDDSSERLHELQDWTVERVAKFQKVFKPRVKKL